MDAIYKCQWKELEGEVAVPLKVNVEQIPASEEKLGEWFAARRFKRQHELHPCVKVMVEFIRYEGA